MALALLTLFLWRAVPPGVGLEWALGAVAVALLAAPWLGGRARLDMLAQLVVSLCAIASATLVTASVLANSGRTLTFPLGPAWLFLALTGLFLATPRLFYARPVGGVRTTAALSLLTLLALGGTGHYAGGSLPGFLAGRSGDHSVQPYLQLVVVFGLMVLASLAQHQGRRRWFGSALLAGATGALAAPIVLGLPPLHDAVLARLVSHDLGGRVGFSDHLQLGTLRGLLDSDALVMRIEGALPSRHLRGIVYTSYHADGRWSSVDAPLVPLPEPLPGAATTTATYTDEAEERVFLPLDASPVSATPDTVLVDAAGIVRSSSGPLERVVWAPAAPYSAPPGVGDLAVPDSLRHVLDGVLGLWTDPHQSPGERVDAIATRLRTDFSYSLDVERPGGDVDPLVHFLIDDRRGHCEYFASAMTLLARAAGVPARTIGGYHVAEQNPMTGRWVVRQRDAHAWTEVWLDGRWRTVDATAPGFAEGRADPSWGSALLDLVADALGRLWHQAQALPSALVVTAIGALLALWLLIRTRRARVGSKGGPPALRRLLEALATRGFAHAPGEPLEALARRLRARGEDGPAAALEAYADARYGSQPLDPALDALERARRALGTRAPAAQ